MKTVWVLTLGVVALTAVQGCKRNEPEPIPGPKAGLAAMAYVHMHAPGIAWFQGSLDEAFAGTATHRNCREHAVAMPRTEPVHSRKHPDPDQPSPIGSCGMEPCPPMTRPRHRLV